MVHQNSSRRILKICGYFPILVGEILLERSVRRQPNEIIPYARDTINRHDYFDNRTICHPRRHVKTRFKLPRG